MTDSQQASDRVPVVICEADGTPVDLARQNRKAFEKSLEQGHLWVVTANERVLPYTDERPVTLEARGSWNMARLAAGSGPDAVGETSGASADSKRAGTAVEAASEFAGPVGQPAGPEGGVTERGDGLASGALGTVLSDLSDVVRTRKRELPEGSYTTHLFQSGSEKIRKKLGEEAVELILASERDRKISETADLLYHLLVLLADDGISLDEVAEELRKR